MIIDAHAYQANMAQERAYRPEVVRQSAFTIYQKCDVPAHWRGWIPDPNAQRRSVGWGGDAPVSPALLRSGVSDLSVLVWAMFWTWYHENDGPLNYDHLTHELFPSPITPARKAEIRAATRQLLGKFIRPGHGAGSKLYRLDYGDTVDEATGLPLETRLGLIRGEQFAELRFQGRSQERMIQPADLVNFARWTTACENGWTIESDRRLAEEWHVPHAAVSASRERLATLGWLIVLPRQGQDDEQDYLVWIAEQYDPNVQMVHLDGTFADQTTSSRNPSNGHIASSHPVEVTTRPSSPSRLIADPAQRGAAASNHQQGSFPMTPSVSGTSTKARLSREQRAADERKVGTSLQAFTARPVRQPLVAGAPPQLTALRVARARRRRRALLDLMSPTYPPANRSDVVSRPHEVYLIHFPEEHCFKVGLTLSASRRINGFTRHGGIVVDRVAVDNRFVAEIIEAEVLALTEEWHRLGDRERPGSGYTEMWSEDGPTVDLDQMKLHTNELVALLRDLMDGRRR